MDLNQEVLLNNYERYLFFTLGFWFLSSFFCSAFSCELFWHVLEDRCLLWRLSVYLGDITYKQMFLYHHGVCCVWIIQMMTEIVFDIFCIENDVLLKLKVKLASIKIKLSNIAYIALLIRSMILSKLPVWIFICSFKLDFRTKPFPQS